ncbi:hypothetical protein OB08_07865 [Microbacterium sp. HJ5]
MPLAASLVSRADLIAKAVASRARVIFVCAPAGFGKTTLLAEWAATESRPSGRMTLRSQDDDPAELLARLADGLDGAHPLDAEVAAVLHGQGVSPLGRGAPTFAKAMATSEAFVLFIDDVQELTSPVSTDVLEVALASVPDGSAVVLASRTRLPRLEHAFAGLGTVVIDQSDLTFDATAARQVFSHLRVDVTTESASAIVAKVEGWPMGVTLAARAAHGADQLVGVTGAAGSVSAFLAEEVFRRIDPADFDFLMSTSVFTDLTEVGCNAILDSTEAAQRLDALAARDVFLARVSDEPPVYRLHQLVRESLLALLDDDGGQRASGLRLRAGAWCERTGNPAAAMEQYLAGGHQREAATLLAEIGRQIYASGRYDSLDRWTSSIGEDMVRGYPPLLAFVSWYTALQGRDDEATRWATEMEEVEVDSSAAWSTAFETMRSMLRVSRLDHGPDAAYAEAAAALRTEGPDSPRRDGMLWLLGQTQVLRGQSLAAAASFREASTASTRLGHPGLVVYSESELMILAMDAGRWDEASVHLRAAMAIIERHGLWDYQASALAFAAAARLAAHQGNTDDVLAAPLARGLRARVSCTPVRPFVAVRSRVQLIRASSDSSVIRQLLTEIDHVCEHRPSLGALSDEVAKLRKAYSAERMTGSGLDPLTPTELRILPYLQTHLTADDLASRFGVSRHTIGTHLRAIYAKLLVTSRGDAVERATAVGLLG